MKRVGLAFAAALALTGRPAVAQDSISTPAAVAHFTPAQAAAFSKQIERDLAGRGARVAMVFRTGRPRDKLPKGIAYTHGAFWVYRDITTANGSVTHGYAVYNLYAGDGKAWKADESRLVQDFPIDFTAGSAVDDVAIIVPSPEMQRRIVAVIDSPAYAGLHNPSYSLIANPLRPQHQNCNSFMLDVVGAAAWNITDRAQLRSDEAAHFTPSVVEVGGVKRFFAPMVDPRVKIDDQSGPLKTATYESMAAFMRDNGLLEAAYTLPFDHRSVPGAYKAAP